MPEHITSFYDIYNRANDAGKATDIQTDDLFILQRVLDGVVKPFVPNYAVAPGWGPAFVSPFPPVPPVAPVANSGTTTTPTASTASAA